MERKRNRKGFTLAELLIVVAIIAVLVAIAIPIFTAQLEKSREATDAANLRSAYAEATADLLTNDASNFSKDVDAKQTQANWQGTDYSTGDNKIGDQNVDASTTGWTVAVNDAKTAVTITPK